MTSRSNRGPILAAEKGEDSRGLCTSASERYITERFGDKVKLNSSETVTEMLDLVQDGRVDATIQDAPAAAYYIQQGRYPGLKVIDEPVGFGYYVILTRPGDDALREQLNDAIRKGVRTGSLHELYKKYGLWNAAQQRLSYLAGQPWPEVAAELDEVPEETRPVVSPKFSQIVGKLVWAAGMTLFLAVTSFPLAMLLGLVVCLAGSTARGRCERFFSLDFKRLMAYIVLLKTFRSP